jgi:hypothetical protein
LTIPARVTGRAAEPISPHHWRKKPFAVPFFVLAAHTDAEGEPANPPSAPRLTYNTTLHPFSSRPG